MGTAGLISQFVAIGVPMALVRLLDMHAYGQYRLMWLVGGTALLIGSLGISSSLLYFIPRSPLEDKRRFVYQTILVLSITSLMSALVVGPWNIWLSDNVRELSRQAFTVPVFVFLWVLSSIIDTLPNADQRIGWQAKSMVFLSLIRACTLIGVAWLSRDIEAVFVAVIAIALLKLTLLIVYTLRFHGLPTDAPRCAQVKEQLGYALPAGIAASMFQLRGLGEQWIVASMFSPAVFGVFTLAATVLPLARLVRRPVQAVILPKMNKAQSVQDSFTVSRFNRRGNLMVTMVLLPAIGLVLVIAEPLMTLLFGADYKGAGLILQASLLGLFPQTLEVGTILLAFAQTRFVMRVSVLLTIVAILLNILGAIFFGPVGAVFGSVFASFAGMIINLRKVVYLTKIPLGKIQDWPRLGAIYVAVILATGMAVLSRWVFIQGGNMWSELLLPSIVFAFVYLLMLWLMGFSWVFNVILGSEKWVEE